MKNLPVEASQKLVDLLREQEKTIESLRERVGQLEKEVEEAQEMVSSLQFIIEDVRKQSSLFCLGCPAFQFVSIERTLVPEQ